MANLVPELTVNLDGVFWHPLSTDADMQVSKKIFPLACGLRAGENAARRDGAHRRRAADDLHLRIADCSRVGQQ